MNKDYPIVKRIRKPIQIRPCNPVSFCSPRNRQKRPNQSYILALENSKNSVTKPLTSQYTCISQQSASPCTRTHHLIKRKTTSQTVLHHTQERVEVQGSMFCLHNVINESPCGRSVAMHIPKNRVHYKVGHPKHAMLHIQNLPSITTA